MASAPPSAARAPATAPLLKVRDLQAWYGESHILHGVAFDVGQGEVVTLLGRNGAGKTTTLALEPELMLLDEPTAGMTHEDVERIAALIKKVSVNRSVLMVEHNLGVVEHLCSTITVLSRGEVLAEGDYAHVSRHPAVVEAYMGTAVG